MNNKAIAAPLYSNGATSYRTKLILLLVSALAFFSMALLSCNNNGSPKSATATKSADSLHSSYDSLRSQFNATHAQVDDLSSKNSTLDSEIQKKDLEIAKLSSRISALEKKNRSLARNAKADKKLIASLREELSGKDKSYTQQIGMLENDKNNLMRQRDSLMAKYNYIKQVGSVLHASDIRLMAVHIKNHGRREKDTHRARKADVLRVSFNIDENRIAEDGVKKLYLVIKDPEGNLLSNPSIGSGTTTSSSGGQLSYSIVKEISLKQNEPVYNISSDWKQDGDFKKGEYSIAIYNEGYRIGGGKVDLN